MSYFRPFSERTVYHEQNEVAILFTVIIKRNLINKKEQESKLKEE